MVCQRCINSVTRILCELNINHKGVLLGEVRLWDKLTNEKKNELNSELTKEGFELIDDKRRQTIEQIKKSLQILLDKEILQDKPTLSKYIMRNIHKDYSYLSNLFSSIEGKTIENYFINLKIEKIKELLVYDELSISEISFKLGYSSAAHLSNQFKKVTGLTPSYFKRIREVKRKPTDIL